MQCKFAGGSVCFGMMKKQGGTQSQEQLLYPAPATKVQPEIISPSLGRSTAIASRCLDLRDLVRFTGVESIELVGHHQT